MPIFAIEWKLATESVIFSGKMVVQGDDSGHARDLAISHLGPDLRAANFNVVGINGPVFVITQREKFSDGEYTKPMPNFAGSTLYSYELAARANVIANSEKTAWSRFAECATKGKSDGKYCKLFRSAVLEREPFGEMSAYERHLIETQFRSLQGGAARSR